MLKKYNKLVRDLIPDMIISSGKKGDFEIVDQQAAYMYLIEKLDEEVLEFKQDQNLEELADILEVVVALANKLGFTEAELLTVRNEKKANRGGFDRNIILKGVQDNKKVDASE